MDASAFETLVCEHQHMVYCVALSYCKDSAAAEDVAQESFLKAFRSMGGLREPARVKTWLFSITRFTAIDWVRRRRRELPGPAPDRPAPVPDEDRAGRVMAVIQGLKDDYRAIMLMRYEQGLSYAEIARETGSSTTAVGEKLSRIRALVRKRLETEVRS